MPNHFHGILVINNENKGDTAFARVTPPLSLGSIIGSFKSRCVVEKLQYIEENVLDEIGKFWQRNYHDQIIRNEINLNRFRKYIQDNPKNWVKDENNPENRGNDDGKVS